MTVTLTKTRMVAGIWEGVFSGIADAPPPVVVTHLGEVVDGAFVKKAAQSDDWVLHVPVPAELLSDSVQTFIISDSDTDQVLNSFTLLSGDGLSEDIRAEMALLREELDMLKSAFRRHCDETISFHPLIDADVAFWVACTSSCGHLGINLTGAPL